MAWRCRRRRTKGIWRRYRRTGYNGTPDRSCWKRPKVCLRGQASMADAMGETSVCWSTAHYYISREGVAYVRWTQPRSPNKRNEGRGRSLGYMGHFTSYATKYKTVSLLACQVTSPQPHVLLAFIASDQSLGLASSAPLVSGALVFYSIHIPIMSGPAHLLCCQRPP